MIVRALAGPSHDEEVAATQIEPPRGAPSFGAEEKSSRTPERDVRDERRVALPSVTVPVPGHAVASVAVEIGPAGAHALTVTLAQGTSHLADDRKPGEVLLSDSRGKSTYRFHTRPALNSVRTQLKWKCLYRRDLAFIHDAGFGAPARGAASLLKRTLAKRKLPHGLVVDLGCGSGILAHELSEAGYPVLGIDVSGPMLRIARERAPVARFRRESLFDATLPQAVAITAIGECLNYRSTESAPSPRLDRLFRRVHRALVPAGLFLFDIAGSDRAPGSGRRESTLEGLDWSVTAVTEMSSRRHTLRRSITAVRRIGKATRRTIERHCVRLYDPTLVAHWLRTAGFAVHRLSGYGSVAFPRGVHGYLCVKHSDEPA